MIGLVVFTDGRLDYLRRTIESAHGALAGHIIEEWMFDDSGDEDHRELIADEFPQFTHVNGGDRQGFCGAIETMWQRLLMDSMADHFFHLEGDFTFNRIVPLDDMVRVLQYRPRLAQVALRRQPWNPTEIAAGGVVEVSPDDFVTHLDRDDRVWLEHSKFFTTNPSIYRRSLIEQFHWPQKRHSEGLFTAQLREAGYNFAYYGPREDGPWVHHIGDERKGHSY